MPRLPILLLLTVLGALPAFSVEDLPKKDEGGVMPPTVPGQEPKPQPPLQTGPTPPGPATGGGLLGGLTAPSQADDEERLQQLEYSIEGCHGLDQDEVDEIMEEIRRIRARQPEQAPPPRSPG